MADKIIYDPNSQSWTKYVETATGEDMFVQLVSVLPPVEIMPPVNSYHHITSDGAEQIKTTTGNLVGVVFNKAVALGQIAIYDHEFSNENTIANIQLPVSLNSDNFFIEYKCKFDSGLRVVVTGVMDITIIYR